MKKNILTRACWWGPNEAETRPRFFDTTQLHHLFDNLVTVLLQLTCSFAWKSSHLAIGMAFNFVKFSELGDYYYD